MAMLSIPSCFMFNSRHSMCALPQRCMAACPHGVRSKLQEALQPVTFKLVNESHKHSGHYQRDGSAASDAGETHFK